MSAAPDAPAAGRARRGRVPGDAVAVTDRRAFTRAVTAPVVPAKAWARLEEIDDLLDQVNDLYAQADKEIARAREEAQAAGFAEGLARAQQQMTEKMAALNESRARVLGEAAGRVTELACAIVARIAPGFDAASVVPPLVMQAVEAAQAEQFLLIRVHPQARAGVEAGLGAVRQAHPAVGVIELVDDESLDPLSCVVVSEAGEVRAGVAQQIEAIRTALAGASRGETA
ncbi:FliH/SctL family protein [Luteimonas sp. JM171]|uniref:FliH/SctL family protein n=1 Tax=Luteimonas sp. JM171 TaxID=1896164 RepID=UPI000ADCBE3B|nr:FliH/SctL family protein [Luteimonas sp. JM171]